MTFWLRPGRNVNLSRRFLLNRRCLEAPFKKRTSYLPRLPIYQDLRSSSSQPPLDNPTNQVPPTTSPQGNGNGDLTREVELLEAYLPGALRQGTEDSSVAGKEDEECQCLSILRLLRQTRKAKGVDLLGHLAFGLNRWDAVQHFVNKLLENASKLRGRHPAPDQLPSNIDWKAVATQSWESPSGINRVSLEMLDLAPNIPVSSTGKFFPLAEFGGDCGSTVSERFCSSTIPNMTLGELWQSLGAFILEAADLPERQSLDAMEYVYEFLAYFQQLDLIPSEVYNAAPSEETQRPRSRAGMPYLQNMIMHVLVDASLGAGHAGPPVTLRTPNSSTPRQRLRMRKRDLDVGNWLEFVLWCCVERGFAREGSWILNQIQKRSNQWGVKSWDVLLQTAGPLDPKRIVYFDTWAECGQNAREDRLFLSRKPFLGMGERTITSEVIVAVMDGLVNYAKIDPDAKETSLSDIWDLIASLRSLLKRNDLYLGAGDVNYLHTRMIESNAIAVDDYATSPVAPLEQAPYALSEDSNGVSEATSGLPAVEHGHRASTLVLGLHSYVLNTDSSLGYVSRALGKFQALLGAVDSDKAHEMRHVALQNRYLIDASPLKDTKELRRQFLGEDKPEFFPKETISSLMLSPLLLSLLFDTLTVSQEQRLGHWLLARNDENQGIIPDKMASDLLLAPALIRFAACFNDHHQFSRLAENLKTPMPREVLKAMVTYQIAQSNWEHAVNFLKYLPERQDCHWGATNVASIGAAVISMSEPPEVGSEGVREANMTHAKQVLTAILEGNFDRYVRPSERRYRYQAEELFHIHRILRSIPGPLGEVCESVKLEWNHPRRPPEGVPVNAFHHILSAVVQSRGSLAGKRLWSEWCIDPFSRLAKRIRLGPNALSRPWDNMAFRIDWKKATSRQRADWHRSQAGKLVLPNLKTVRIISMRAVEEQKSIWRGDPALAPSTTESGETGVLDVLNWCVDMFKGFGLTELEINRELDGHLARTRQEIAARNNE